MRKTTNTLKVAFRALARNKMRSILTMLGIIIGVACVVATIGIGEGARLQTENQLRSLGTNFLMIMPGSTTSGGARTGFGMANSKLQDADVDAIRREVGSVAYVSAATRTVAQVVYGNQNWSTSIQGGEVDWPLIRSCCSRSNWPFMESRARSMTTGWSTSVSTSSRMMAPKPQQMQSMNERLKISVSRRFSFMADTSLHVHRDGCFMASPPPAS